MTPSVNAKNKPGSVGCVVTNMQVKLIGLDGKPVPAHTFGEVLCKGPNRMKGAYSFEYYYLLKLIFIIKRVLEEP